MFDSWVGKIPWRRAWLPSSSTLAWRIPWTEDPGGLQSMGSQSAGHDWRDLACMHTACPLDLFHFWNRLFVTPWTEACQAPLPSAISWSLLKFMSIESVMPSNWKVVAEPWKDDGILGLRRRRIQSRSRDEAWSLRVLCNKVLLKYKGDRESLWHRHQKGAERVPPW